ncbi:hypothetical protein LCGC14_2166340 [marine sediment metagenome]|uniref:HNH nuclease domain-containing protein n=1 Tax=marine sediment metagenome TaxID=412755 RepID=A0A0F9G445_9ZZZZ
MSKKKTHCKHGHEYTEANSYYYRNRRYCRKCRKDSKKKSGRRVLNPAMRNFRLRLIKRRDNKTCRYCGTETSNGQIDHVEPQSKGGADNPTNLVWSCPTCNQTKGSEEGMTMVDGEVYWKGEGDAEISLVAPNYLFGPALMDKIKQQKYESQRKQGLIEVTDYKERMEEINVESV